MLLIGLFGGSFNPVHLGHLLTAQAAWEELALSHLFFIPAAQSPFKPGAPKAPGSERLRMLRLALAGRTGWSIDGQEIARGGISYSIDTVRNYASQFPGSRLFYVIGGDQVSSLPRWRAAAELAKLVEFAVINRPGQPFEPLPHPFRGRALRGWPFEVSASQIRERVRAGLSIELLVPGPVVEAIRNNRLYL